MKTCRKYKTNGWFVNNVVFILLHIFYTICCVNFNIFNSTLLFLFSILQDITVLAVLIMMHDLTMSLCHYVTIMTQIVCVHCTSI